MQAAWTLIRSFVFACHFCIQFSPTICSDTIKFSRLRYQSMGRYICHTAVDRKDAPIPGCIWSAGTLRHNHACPNPPPPNDSGHCPRLSVSTIVSEVSTRVRLHWSQSFCVFYPSGLAFVIVRVTNYGMNYEVTCPASSSNKHCTKFSFVIVLPLLHTIRVLHLHIDVA